MERKERMTGPWYLISMPLSLFWNKVYDAIKHDSRIRLATKSKQIDKNHS